jgi:hypothetical protein
VIVKTWDERRLVLPITHFVEKPFENWTRTSSQLVGIVMIYADYRLPVDRLLAAFESMVRADPDWDGEVLELVVVEMAEQTVAIRGTASAQAPAVWGLR